LFARLRKEATASATDFEQLEEIANARQERRPRFCAFLASYVAIMVDLKISHRRMRALIPARCGHRLELMDRAHPLAAEFTELLGGSPRESAGWDPFFLQVVDETPLHARVLFRDLALGVYLSGRHMIRRQIGANVVEGWSDPGTINLTPPGVEGIWEASASSRAAVVAIRPEFLSRVIEEHWGADSAKVEIIEQFLIRDPVIEAIALNLAREAASGSPAGRLYAESSCEFLAHHLIYCYSSLSRPPPRSKGGLSSRGLRLVLQYIEDTLGQPIKLRSLAALAGISVRHFERAFRQSMGVPPHAYAMERQLQMARDLLINQLELPVEQIALRVGFSSSSHFSSAFRRWTGFTPTTFRKTWSL
jgi:AraC family transcriptional regulator